MINESFQEIQTHIREEVRMPIYKTILRSKEEIADGTMAFHFEKPVGFVFKAGQFGDFTLINPGETDAEGNIRGFSLASAPYEDDLMIATRMRDTAFKRILRKMEAGTEISLDAPYGSFTLHNNSRIPAVFLTGGIGVTPVRSIVLQAAHDNLPHKIFLFDTNRRPEDSAFLNELMETQEKNPNYTFIGTMTEMEKSNRQWDGETGYINKAMLAKHVGDLTLPIYYVAGPASMVTAMRKTLNEAGVDDDNIRTEEFSGY
jgi:ferredoxin-NADP reductase